MKPHLAISREGAIGSIKFVNPAKLNALTHEMWSGLGDALNAFSDDDGIRAVLISGEGRKAFTTGADIEQFADFDTAEFDRVVRHAQHALDRATKPTIAVVHGYCVGGGFDIGLRCDMRFADTNAQFGAPDPKLGTAWGPGTKVLIDAVGAPRAREIILSCRLVPAEEARQIGIANRIFDPDELWDAAMAEAQRIAEYAPLSIKAAKRTFHELLSTFSPPDIEKIYSFVKECTDSADFVEGQRAFAERRKPVFRGR
jgi:enoyl-CoA hydratase/carnithine racemase